MKIGGLLKYTEIFNNKDEYIEYFESNISEVLIKTYYGRGNVKRITIDRFNKHLLKRNIIANNIQLIDIKS